MHRQTEQTDNRLKSIAGDLLWECFSVAERGSDMEIKSVMVIGAGIMGRGIAQVCVEAGLPTVLYDADSAAVADAVDKIGYFLQRKVDKGQIEAAAKDKACGLLQPAGDIAAGKSADLVIEAVTENVEVKRGIFQKLDSVCKEETIFASNTSSISITLLASATRRPNQCIGMHFFVPAPMMALVEVIPGLLTGDETTETAIAFARQLGKSPVKAPDTSGFLVNRLLVPMWNEASYLVMEGNDPKDVDEALKLGANHPMGPLELADFAGLDTVLSAMTQLFQDFGDPKYRPCPLLKQMVTAGLLGRKSGRGFHTYK